MRTSLNNLVAQTRAFTLVEVVLALGIFSFAGLGLVGLFSVGIGANRDSAESLDATHIAQKLLAERRGAPALESDSLILKPLTEERAMNAAAPEFLTSDGQRATGSKPARYGLLYRVQPHPGGAYSQVYLCLYWPARAAPADVQGKVEFLTNIPLQ